MDFCKILPLELSLKIFFYIDFDDLLNQATVSSSWNTVISDPSLWRDINVNNKFKKDILLLISKASYIRKFTCYRCDITSDILKAISTKNQKLEFIRLLVYSAQLENLQIVITCGTNLKSLKIANKEIGGPELSTIIKNNQNLTSVGIATGGNIECAIISLTFCVNLRHLKILATEQQLFYNDTLMATIIQNCKNLQWLGLEYLRYVTDITLENIVKYCKNLNRLGIVQKSSISYNGLLNFFSKAPKTITSYKLCISFVDDLILETLVDNCKNVKTIKLADFSCHKADCYTKKGILYILNEAKNLQKLKLEKKQTIRVFKNNLQEIIDKILSA